MIEIPLELLNLHDDGFHLLVEVVVSGQVYKAVIDTGASKTVLDKTIAAELFNEDDLLLTEQLSTGLGTNSMESFKMTVSEFSIGKYTIQHFEAAVLDLSAIHIAYEKLNLPKIIGVIGGDLFMRYKATISYQNLTMTLNTD